MLPTQRRQAILAQVRERAAVSAEDLARQFGVSVETIRRDLRRLQDRGLLERVYGGATRPSGRSSEGSFAARSARHTGRKQAIATLAASLVEPEDTVVIDVGTTALEVARALPAGFRGRVLTNSVPAAMELSTRSDVELLLCGGQVRAGDGACAGAHAEAFFGEFYADRAFLGSGGVHPEAGLTDYYPAEVAVRRTIIDHTASTYVLADSSKLGEIAVHRVCTLDRLTAVLTDDAENSAAFAALAAAGLTLLRATVTEHPEATAADGRPRLTAAP
ncbi:MAG TPA: DeoR/GlpR family DNA-binding transcription regulator [Streptosporangiaceae bacterium]|nr:DeoR/GlpR family DNA-binding transcription regulator [Streptosporangiaceae bacterium]